MLSFYWLIYMCFDIFSGFDAANGVIWWACSMVLWFLPIFFIFVFMLKLWSSKSVKGALMSLMLIVMFFLIMRSNGRFLSGFSLIVSSLFIFVLLLNLLGLVPYMFSLTSHLMMTFSFSLPMWFSLILSGAFYDVVAVVAHLVILGAPEFLLSILVLIESVSISIRPVTLGVRLIANMSAGHVVLILLGAYICSCVFSFSLLILLLFCVLGIFYFMFEGGVSFIQGYVFSLLCILYSDDHPTH